MFRILERQCFKLWVNIFSIHFFQIHIRDVLVFPASFWLVCLICVGYYVAVFPFISLGKVYFQVKYNFSSDNANFITGNHSDIFSPLLTAMLSGPFFQFT